jgi:hypothetical protein
MAKVMIAIGGKDSERSMEGPQKEMEDSIEESISQEDEGFLSMIEGVKLSPKALTGLTNSINKVLPMFGLPAITGRELSADLVRVLKMVEQATVDASESEEVPMELLFSVSDLSEGDAAAMVIAGKLDRLSRTPSFKKFLKTTEGSEMAKEMTPAGQPPMGDQMALDKTAEQSPNIEKLFSSRMS